MVAIMEILEWSTTPQLWIALFTKLEQVLGPNRPKTLILSHSGDIQILGFRPLFLLSPADGAERKRV